MNDDIRNLRGQNNTYLQDLKVYVIHRWLIRSADVKQDIRLFWALRDEITVIDGVAMKIK